MISLDDALAAYAANLRALPVQTVPVLEALGSVLAAPACAATDLPRFDMSAMDGYAFRAADTALASETHPRLLPIRLNLAAEAQATLPVLAPGTAARILTGAMLPAGADSIVPQERIRRVDDRLHFSAPYPAQNNIRRRGEELRVGTQLADAGQRVGPGLLASLVNAGVATVQVHARPRIRVLISGDEIRPAGTALQQGEIHDSNGPLVTALLAGWGFYVAPAQHIGDDFDRTRDALADAFSQSDLILSSGGASVGDKDHLPAAAESLGVRRVFWKIAQKPGKPLYFGVREKDGLQCAMMALPGNPGAVLIGMILHVRSALDALQGQREPTARWSAGVLAETVERDSERVRLLRMRLAHNERGVATLTPLPHQDSHMLSNLGSADVLVRVEAGAEPVKSGAVLRWTRLPG